MSWLVLSCTHRAPRLSPIVPPQQRKAGGGKEDGKGHCKDNSPKMTKGIFHTLWHLLTNKSYERENCYENVSYKTTLKVPPFPLASFQSHPLFMYYVLFLRIKFTRICSSLSLAFSEELLLQKQSKKLLIDSAVFKYLSSEISQNLEIYFALIWYFQQTTFILWLSWAKMSWLFSDCSKVLFNFVILL